MTIEERPTMTEPGAVEVRRSGIEGLGLFACRAFNAGDCLHRINVVREITADAPLREELNERFDHCDYPHGKVVLIGFPSRSFNERRLTTACSRRRSVPS